MHEDKKQNKADYYDEKEGFLKISLRFIWETLYNFLMILVVVVVIRTFFVSPFHVSGNSMTDTLSNNDYIIIDKLSYNLMYPDFGDVVVFTPPSPRIRKVTGIKCLISKFSKFQFNEDACNIPDFFIKRIIGMPGDTIKIEDGEVYRNEKQLDEEYLSENNSHRTFVPEKDQVKEYTVPKNSYFVMGDNRNGSSDSRSYANEWKNYETGEHAHFISEESIEGRYLFVLFSPEKVQKFIYSLKGE